MACTGIIHSRSFGEAVPLTAGQKRIFRRLFRSLPEWRHQISALSMMFDGLPNSQESGPEVVRLLLHPSAHG